MNNIKQLLIIATCSVFLAACGSSSDKPSRTEAIAALQLRSPDTAWARIRTHDSLWVNTYLPLILKSGMVQLNKKATDSTGQFLFFTPAASHFFFPTPEDEKTQGIQRVFLAHAAFISLLNVGSTSDPDKARLTYVVEYRDLSPFAALAEKLHDGRRDTFSQPIFRHNGVWQLDKNRRE